MGYGAIVNHTDDKEKQNVELRWIEGRVRRNKDSGDVVYMALRDIEPGEEVLGNYGDAVGKEVQWFSEKSQIFAKEEDVWESFLALDLYNLGILRDRL